MTGRSELLLVLGPDTGADPELLAGQAESAATELGIGLRIATSDSPEDTARLLAEHSGPAVVVPADPAVCAASTTPAFPDAVCYDLRIAPVVHGPRHLHGRGVWGLVWAVRHAVHRWRHPAERVGYGTDPEQWVEVRRPAAPVGAAPVAVLLHGGFWRSVWGADLMDALAIDLIERGWVAVNLEYRRPDRHGWSATTPDVEAGVAAIDRLYPGRPTVLFGHSAGGQLALRLAADRPGLALVVSLAGVVDLLEGYRRGVGDGAIPAALGGTPQEVAGVYAAADPFRRLPLATPALLVQGEQDSPDLIDFNRRFAAASGARLIEQPGDHFDVITPTSPIWRATVAATEEILRRS